MHKRKEEGPGCIGLLCKFKQGKQYQVTVVDTATRYSEVKDVDKCFLQLFTSLRILRDSV